MRSESVVSRQSWVSRPVGMSQSSFTMTDGTHVKKKKESGIQFYWNFKISKIDLDCGLRQTTEATRNNPDRGQQQINQLHQHQQPRDDDRLTNR